MALRVVTNGGKRVKGGGGPKKPPTPRKKTQLEIVADELFSVLPAPDREEIAKRLSKRLSRTVPVAEVDQALLYVRSHAIELEWTINYAPRGRNAEGNDRYIVKIRNRDGTWHTDEELIACDEGMLSAYRATATTLRQSVEMLVAEAARTRSRNIVRRAKATVTTLEYMVGQMESIIEELAEEMNGSE